MMENPLRNRGSTESDNLQGLLPRNDIQVLAELGQGQFGKVHAGKYTTRLPNGQAFTTAVALKKVNARHLADPKAKQAIIDENRRLAKLLHPFITRYFGCAVDPDGSLMLVMEFCNKGDLKQYVRSCKTDTDYHHLSAIAQGEMLLLALQVSSAVAHVHSCKMLHRDIAARNVMLSLDANTGIMAAKLGDFGMTRETSDASDYYGT
eukprot:g4634.t1